MVLKEKEREKKLVLTYMEASALGSQTVEWLLEEHSIWREVTSFIRFYSTRLLENIAIFKSVLSLLCFKSEFFFKSDCF